MTSMLTVLRARARRRADDKRTRDQIARLPLDVALDLDIHRDDADRIAQRAVYGA